MSFWPLFPGYLSVNLLYSLCSLQFGLILYLTYTSCYKSSSEVCYPACSPAARTQLHTTQCFSRIPVNGAITHWEAESGPRKPQHLLFSYSSTPFPNPVKSHHSSCMPSLFPLSCCLCTQSRHHGLSEFQRQSPTGSYSCPTLGHTTQQS